MNGIISAPALSEHIRYAIENGAQSNAITRSEIRDLIEIAHADGYISEIERDNFADLVGEGRASDSWHPTLDDGVKEAVRFALLDTVLLDRAVSSAIDEGPVRGFISGSEADEIIEAIRFGDGTSAYEMEELKNLLARRTWFDEAATNLPGFNEPALSRQAYEKLRAYANDPVPAHVPGGPGPFGPSW